MLSHPQPPRARHWEEAGIAFGVLLVAINWFATATPWLTGPLFHPVLILLGAVLCFACAALLAGAASDAYETG